MPPILIGLLLMAASVLITSMMVHKQKPPTPAGLEEFDIPQVEEGVPQGVLFGQGWTKGWQSLWYGDLDTVKIKAKSGKK